MRFSLGSLGVSAPREKQHPLNIANLILSQWINVSSSSERTNDLWRMLVRPGTKILTNRSFSLQIAVSFWKIAPDSAASGYRMSPTIPSRVLFAKLSRNLFGITLKTRERDRERREEGEWIRSRLSWNSRMKWPATGWYSWIIIEIGQQIFHTDCFPQIAGSRSLVCLRSIRLCQINKSNLSRDITIY